MSGFNAFTEILSVTRESVSLSRNQRSFRCLDSRDKLNIDPECREECQKEVEKCGLMMRMVVAMVTGEMKETQIGRAASMHNGTSCNEHRCHYHDNSHHHDSDDDDADGDDDGDSGNDDKLCFQFSSGSLQYAPETFSFNIWR